MGSIIDKVAWLHVVDGRILCARSRGKDTYYVPGGKREAGETELETLAREIEEELSVRIQPESAVHYGTFEAEAHGKTDGAIVKMSCYTAEADGELSPASEIEELAWLTYQDKGRVSEVSRLIFDRLYETKQLID